MMSPSASQASDSAIPGGWTTCAAVYVGLAFLYCWPMLLAIGAALPNDTGDPGLIAWGFWWNSQALPFTERWWNAPIFFPASGMLALSETFLGIAPLTTPLLWAGIGPVATYNLTFLIAIPATAIATHALVHRLTGRHDAALIAGLAFGFSPYRGSQMPHLHLLLTWWMPLALLSLHRYIDTRRTLFLVLFGVCWMFNGLMTGYYLVFFAVLVGLWMLWFVRAWHDWIRIGVAAAVASLPFVPMLVGYKRIQGALGFERSIGEIETFSADLTAFLSASWHNWLPFQWTLAPNPEGELYPGAAIVVLAVAGLIVAIRRANRLPPVRVRRWLFALALASFALGLVSWSVGGLRLELPGMTLSATRPHRTVSVGFWLMTAALLADRRVIDAWRRRSAFAFYALATCAMAFLALGPVVKLLGVEILQATPYDWLMELPGGGSLRVPARFAMLFMLCLSCAAGLSLVRLTPGGAARRTVFVVALLVLADGWVPKMLMAPVQASINLPGLAEDTVVLELPMRDLFSDTAAMLRATDHGRPLVNGFSGYAPHHYSTLVEGLQSGDASIFTALRTLAPLAVLVNRADDSTGAHEQFVHAADGAQLLYRTPLGPVYRFSRQPAQPALSAPLVPVRSISTSVNHEIAWAAIDGNRDTQWQTLGPQQSGEQVSLTFDALSDISRVEMDLGEMHLNYPRELRIEARLDDGSLATVWHGGTAGPAVVGILRAWRTATISVVLPAHVRASGLVLTQTGSSRDFYWTIADLRVFGATAPGPAGYEGQN